MLYFLYQLYSTVTTGTVYLFEIFVLYTWFVYSTKLLFARKFFKREATYGYVSTILHLKASVIIPIFNEDPEALKRCFDSLRDPYIDEIIPIFDQREKSFQLKRLADMRGFKSLRANAAGKRAAVAQGLQVAKNDIVILMDSDTFFEKGAIFKLLQPFNDPHIAGVTSNQRIYHPERNVVRRVANWMEIVRFTIASIPAQAYFEHVACLPGRAIAFRRKLLIPHIPSFLSQVVMGIKEETGDDRFLTSVLLREGHKLTFAPDAHVLTDAPNTWRAMIKQQIRWARSSQRETILSLRWLWKFPFTFLVFVTDIITPLFFVAVIALTSYGVWIGAPLGPHLVAVIALVMGFVGMNITIGVKSYPVFKDKKYFRYLPVYAFFSMVIMIPIRIYGLITCWRGGLTTWTTRKVEK